MRFPSRSAFALALACVLALWGTNPDESDAQFASLRGRVVDSDNEPLEGVNVVLTRAGQPPIGTATEDGFYLIGRIPEGTYQLRFSYVGFVSVVDTIRFQSGDRFTRNVTMAVDLRTFDPIVVESERRVVAVDHAAGLQSARPATLERLNTVGLSPDLAGMLYSSASVVSVGDRGGQFFVRGGTPMQNLFLLDGMRILQPVHILNAYSVFPAEILSFADLYAGGFGAYYGGRTAAVIDVHTRNGNKRRLQGSASVSPVLGSVRLDVPLSRDRVSVVASVRESLIQDYGSVVDETLPYHFGDRFVKFHAFLNQTSNLSITSLRSFDRGNLAGSPEVLRNVEWSNQSYGANFFYLSPVLPVLTEITLSLTRFDMLKGPSGDPDQSSKVRGIDGSFNFGYLLGAYQVHFGIFAQTTQFTYRLGRALRDETEEFVTEGGAFIEGRFDPSERIHFSPGVRVHSFPSRGQSYAEPRLRATMRLPRPLRAYTLGLAWGIYHQLVVGLSDDRAVSDVFTAWSASPPNRQVPTSTHYLASLERQFRSAKVRIEGYRRVIEHQAFPSLGQALTTNTRFLDASGVAAGLDVTGSLQRRNAFVEGSYSLSSVRYESGGNEFRPPHDRRHSLSMNFGLAFRNVRLKGLWRYGSGLPVTLLNGYFDTLPVELDEPAFRTDPGTRSVLFDESFAGRLPAFHRLDVSGETFFTVGPNVRMTLQAGLINAYGRRNWFDIDYSSLLRVDQLPFLPSAGIKVDVE